MDAKTPLFELVVPAYNEANSLHAIIDRAVKAAVTAGLRPGAFRLVVVDNGSTDESAKVLAELAGTDLGRWFDVVRVDRNKGYGFGLWTGLAATVAPIVGWTHADMQTDPADAMKAYAIVAAAAAPRVLVKGSRRGRNWKDWCVSRVFESCARLFLGLRIREINAQPKVFHRQLLECMVAPPPTFAFDLYALYHAQRRGFEIQSIPVMFPPRVHGISHWAATFAGRYKTILGMVAYMRELSRSEGRL